MFEKFVMHFAKPHRLAILRVISITLFFLFSGFFLLILLFPTEFISTKDIDWTLSLQNFSTPLITRFMVFISLFGDIVIAAFLGLAFIAFLAWLGYRKEALFSVSIFVAPLLSFFSKTLIARPRPQEYLISGYQLPVDYSFPSGHVLFYTVFFGLVAFLAVSLPKLHPLWRFVLLSLSIPLIALVGLSRIYLGVHWPTDVIAGYLLGFAILEVLIFVYLRYIYLPEMRKKQDKAHDGGKN